MKFLGRLATMKRARVHSGAPTDLWPKKFLGRIEPQDVVQVLMTEQMARNFEYHCLGPHTVAHTRLSVPLLFRQDDLPTYSIDISDNHPTPLCGTCQDREGVICDLCGNGLVPPEERSVPFRPKTFRSKKKLMCGCPEVVGPISDDPGPTQAGQWCKNCQKVIWLG